jgi:hypothetical protein
MRTQTFYKDFNIYCFNRKVEERRRLPSQLSFPNQFFQFNKTAPTLCSESEGAHTQISFARSTYPIYLRLHFALDSNILRFLDLQHAIYMICVVEDFIVNHLEERTVDGNR